MLVLLDLLLLVLLVLVVLLDLLDLQVLLDWILDLLLHLVLLPTEICGGKVIQDVYMFIMMMVTVLSG